MPLETRPGTCVLGPPVTWTPHTRPLRLMPQPPWSHTFLNILSVTSSISLQHEGVFPGLHIWAQLFPAQLDPRSKWACSPHVRPVPCSAPLPVPLSPPSSWGRWCPQEDTFQWERDGCQLSRPSKRRPGRTPILLAEPRRPPLGWGGGVAPEDSGSCSQKLSPAAGQARTGVHSGEVFS